jgi:hypothetical protein
MTEYPHLFPNSTKISYTIAMMKTEGYVTEKQILDTESYEKCIKEHLARHPRASENRARKECVRKLGGYKSILYITEGGVIDYCERVKPYVREPATWVNLKILEVCGTYKTEGEVTRA